MKMVSTTHQDFEVVTLAGPLDIETVSELKEDFVALTERSTRGVILDMAGVTFLDSSGVGALVFMFKRLKAKQQRLHLVGLKNQPLKLVGLLRIDQTIPTHNELSDVPSTADASVALGN